MKQCKFTNNQETDHHILSCQWSVILIDSLLVYFPLACSKKGMTGSWMKSSSTTEVYIIIVFTCTLFVHMLVKFEIYMQEFTIWHLFAIPNCLNGTIKRCIKLLDMYEMLCFFTYECNRFKFQYQTTVQVQNSMWTYAYRNIHRLVWQLSV